MTDIEVPEVVSFYTQEHRNGIWVWGHYCFAHAVLRALEGERILTKLATVTEWCDDCKNFGPPRTHQLDTLRR